MYKKLNASPYVKWLAMIVITFNFLFSTIVRSRSEYFIEGFVLVLLSVWLTWFRCYLISLVPMLLCWYLFFASWQ